MVQKWFVGASADVQTFLIFLVSFTHHHIVTVKNYIVHSDAGTPLNGTVNNPNKPSVENTTSAATTIADDSNGDGPKAPTTTVNSTAMQSAGNHTTPVTICDSDGKANQTFLQYLLEEFSGNVNPPRVIIAFVTGILLSATFCCLTRACHRKKRRSENLAVNLEMVTTQTGALINDGQAVEFDDGTYDQAAEAAGTSAPAGDQELKEVEYSNIMFCASQCSLTEARDSQDPTETEYAEIKKGAMEEGQDDGGEGGEVLEDNREGDEEMLEEELEMGLSVSAGEEGEDGGVYSKVT